MHKFILFIIFQLHIVFLSIIPGQSEAEVVRFDYPKYIPINTSFNVSAVIKFEETPFETVVLTFEKLREVQFKTAYFYLGGKNKKAIDIAETKDEITVTINPYDFEIIPGKPYQLVFICKISSPFKFHNPLISYKNKNDLDIEDFVDSEREEIISRLYVPQKTAGKALRMDKKSELKIKLNKENEELNSVFIEFWFKSENKLQNFLSILEQTTSDTLVGLSKNDFSYITFNRLVDEVPIEEAYLGKRGWNYFGIFITNKYGEIRADIYINSKLIYSSIVENVTNISQLQFNFTNYSKDKSFELERLKIWEYKNSLDLADRKKHFQVYDADSSKLLYGTGFDNLSEFENITETENIIIQSSNLKYNRSTAPIFSKAPKLNVTMGNSYNSIVWYVQEYSFAKEFILEKAVKDGNYQEVYKTYAEDDPLKIYYYTDEILNENEITFYRVRQINKDGSEVSSAEVKIGHNNIAEFSLSQNYPNPFNPVTSIYVDVIVAAKFEVKVYDLVGNIVEQLFEGYLPQGMHTFEFNGSNLPSGIYFYEVISPKSQVVKKMILAK